MQRYETTIKTALGIVGFLALVLLGAALFDFRGLAEARLNAALGRPVTIGTLEVDIFPLEFTATQVRVPPREGEVQAPLDAGLVEARIAFWRLVFGDLVFPRLMIADTRVLISRDAQGRSNWGGSAAPSDNNESPNLPEITDLTLRDVEVRFQDRGSKTDLRFALATGEQQEGERSLHVKGTGSYKGAPTIIAGTGGSILRLRSEETPYPIDLNFTSGGTRIRAKGSVTDPVHVGGLNIRLAMEGEDASDLYRILGIALPPTPPYTFASHLDRDGLRWIAKDLTWKMGTSDLAGTMTWDLSEAVPRLTGTLRATTLDMKDLAGFIGGRPGPEPTPTAERRAAAERELARRTVPGTPQPTVAAELVIPDKALDLTKLKSMNAKVGLEAARVTGSGIPLDTLSVTIALENGLLTLKPLRFGIDPGHISGEVVVDGSKEQVRSHIKASVQAYPIRRLVGKAGEQMENTTFGAIGGQFELQGTGNSAHRFAASAEGSVGLIAGGGQLSLLLVEFAGLDLAEALGLLITKDKPVEIRCGVADFKIAQGVMRTDAFVIDTNDTLFSGSGNIDLGREIMDMKIRPKPKDVSPISLRSPILVAGTFAKPHVGPDLAVAGAKAGLAAALGALLTPLASLLVTLDLGGGKDANCAALFQDVGR